MAISGDAMLDRTALFRIERVQIGSGQRSQHESSPVACRTLGDSIVHRNEIVIHRTTR
jgi:hypothetical protein